MLLCTRFYPNSDSIDFLKFYMVCLKITDQIMICLLSKNTKGGPNNIHVHAQYLLSPEFYVARELHYVEEVTWRME